MYWTDGEYLAIGAGAHGYLYGERYENIAHPREYTAALESPAGPRPAMVSSYVPDSATSMSDWLTLRLRLLRGFQSTEFEQRFGVAFQTVAGGAIVDCVAAGVLEAGDAVRLTSAGRLLHGEVAARLTVAIRDSLSAPG